MKLQLNQVTFEYPDGTRAIDAMSCCINSGDKIAMLGANGAGKSTLFMLLTGLLKPTDGKLLLDGNAYPTRGKPLGELRRRIGLVFQNPEDQLFAMTVEQEVAFGAINLGLTEQEVRGRTRAALESVAVLELAEKPLHHLSFGQKKRVSIADLLVMDVDLLLLDEPAAWLDPVSAESLTELLDTLHSRGCTLLCSTHDVNWAYSWADRVFIMAEGNLLFDGEPAAGLNDMQVLGRASLKRPLLAQTAELMRERELISKNSFPRRMHELAWELDRLDHGAGNIRGRGNEGSGGLRFGYTTGSSAAAAAGAAVGMLIRGRALNKYELVLPDDYRLTVTITNVELKPGVSASCAVRKDAGDDPDITDGLLIFARAGFISRSSSSQSADLIAQIPLPGRTDNLTLRVRCGEGIGRVTRIGLPAQVGKPALNPEPYNQLIKSVKQALSLYSSESPEQRGVQRCIPELDTDETELLIELSIPGGAEVAAKTYNPRLGIKGGISILGTSGLVRPMSEDAWQESLLTELRMVRAQGHTEVYFAFGQYGLSYLREFSLYDPEKTVIISNFVGFMLEQAARLGFTHVLLLGHLGKMIKVSAGIFQTHSKKADARLETLTAYAALAGGSSDTLRLIYESATTDAAAEVIRENGLDAVFDHAAAQAAARAQQYVHGVLKIGIMIFDGSGRLLAQIKTDEVEKNG
jgi:cobalamin biosynthesis protein CbiD